MPDTEFDIQRFRRLARKAEHGDLSDEERDELRDQLQGLHSALSDLAGAFRDVQRAVARQVAPLTDSESSTAGRETSVSESPDLAKRRRRCRELEEVVPWAELFDLEVPDAE